MRPFHCHLSYSKSPDRAEGSGNPGEVEVTKTLTVRRSGISSWVYVLSVKIKIFASHIKQLIEIIQQNIIQQVTKKGNECGKGTFGGGGKRMGRS